MSRAGKVLRLGYLVGRALAHTLTRRRLSPTSPTGRACRRQWDAVTMAPGRELEVVIACESCRSVAIVDHGVGEVRLIWQGTDCPVVDAWRELVRLDHDLPEAKVR